MMRRSPMRRTGWPHKLGTTQAHTPEKETNQPLAHAECAQTAIKKIVKSTAKMAKIEGMGTTKPKHQYIRSKELMIACRGLACQHCGRDDGTVCAAHSNQGRHHKGRGIKADDNRVASLCSRCHTMVDQSYTMTKEEREEIWGKAHAKTVQALLARGMWPNGVEVPELEGQSDETRN